jgi:hypothetical protein
MASMGVLPTPLRDTDPATVGAYRLRGVLGVGGMGTVYLAAGADGRDVALKVINPALHGDPQFRRRFAAEAAAASRVAGFCTARVLDVALDGPVPHLVTEYVQGSSLHDYATANGPLAGHVEAVAVGVAAALTAVHAVGLVHADLSPRNVLLSPFGPKVIDFGVARLLGHTGPANGPHFGTPGWLAPEQVHGGPPSQASDVYAWGLLVAWSGTGRMPPTDAPELAGLDPRLADVVGRALRTDPAARPTARQVLLALVGQDDPAAVHVPSVGSASVTATFRHGVRPGQRPRPAFAPGSAPVSPRPAPAPPTAAVLSGGPPATGSRAGARRHPRHGSGFPASGTSGADRRGSGPPRAGVPPTMIDPTGRSRALPPVPPPPRRRPRRAGRAVMAGIALVALLACLLGALKLAESAGGGGGAEPGATPEAQRARSKAPEPKPSPVAADGKLRFTVAGFSCGTAELGPWPVTKKAQGQFCLVELRVQNIGDGKGRVWLGSQHLRDVDDKEYSPDELSWIYYDRTRPLLNEIGPGNSVTGTLVFDVPPGLTFAALRVKDTPLSAGSTIRLR